MLFLRNTCFVWLSQRRNSGFLISFGPAVFGSVNPRIGRRCYLIRGVRTKRRIPFQKALESEDVMFAPNQTRRYCFSITLQGVRNFCMKYECRQAEMDRDLVKCQWRNMAVGSKMNSTQQYCSAKHRGGVLFRVPIASVIVPIVSRYCSCIIVWVTIYVDLLVDSQSDGSKEGACHHYCSPVTSTCQVIRSQSG